MGNTRKSSWRMYSAWNYEKETEDLDKASEQGWQLVKGGCFHNKFEKNPGVRYRYQLDYGRIDNMGRYIETFREQGWEYINSTFNGWHYFRKAWDPSLPEEAFRIYTDRESIHEMNTRWGRLALWIAISLACFALYYGVQLVRTPQLPLLIMTLTFVLESGLLIRGWLIMRNPDSGRSRKGDSAMLTVMIAVILLGAAGSITLLSMRPHVHTSQQASGLDYPITNESWVNFEVKYADNYYLDLDMKADRPMTFEILNERGEPVYTKTELSFCGEDIRVHLPSGSYSFSLSCDTGFRIDTSID